MNNLYANYFCQKFFTFLEEKDRIIFMNNMKSGIVFIANSKVGTYPLQAIIESLRYKEEKMILLEGLADDVLDLCKVL